MGKCCANGWIIAGLRLGRGLSFQHLAVHKVGRLCSNRAMVGDVDERKRTLRHGSCGPFKRQSENTDSCG